MTQQIKEFFKVKKLKISNGETLAYRECGSGKQALLLVHGNLISSLYWKPLIAHLDLARFRVYAVDMRGFGNSTYLQRIETLEELAEDIYEFITSLKLQKPVLAGWSTGGGVCLHLASKYPDLSAHVVLVASIHAQGKHFMIKDAVTGQKRKCATLDEVRSLPELAQLGQLIRTRAEGQIRSIFDLMLFSNIPPLSEEEYKEYIDEVLKCACYLDVTPALNFFDVLPILKQCKARILIYHGTQDLVIPSKFADLNSKLFTKERCTYILKDGCTHSPPFDFPQELATAIHNFVWSESTEKQATAKL